MIAILGGGITAIAAAIELEKQGKDFLLIEKSDRLGGKIQSANIEGYQLEFGPNTVLINHPETKAFLDTLGLYQKRIQPHEKAIKRRFVLKKGKIQPIPHSFQTLFKSKLFGLNTLVSIFKEPFKKQKVSTTEESLANFSRRRFGKQIYEDLITPFVSGIYAGDPEKMSLEYTMPLLYKAEQSFGSVVKGMPKLIKQKRSDQLEQDMPKQKIFSFKSGLQLMIDTAAERIYSKLKLNTEVLSIRKEGDHYELKLLKDGQESSLQAAQVLSCLPAHILAEKIGFDNHLVSGFNTINYVPATVSHMAFKASQWNFDREAFGLLSRKDEGHPWLGILFNSEFFPQQQKNDDILLTIISGGYRQPDFIKLGDEAILKQLRASLTEIGLVKGDECFHHIYRWEKAIPQYELGYSEIKHSIERFLEANPNFKIGGNYFRGISVSDCIANGTILAREI